MNHRFETTDGLPGEIEQPTRPIVEMDLQGQMEALQKLRRELAEGAQPGTPLAMIGGTFPTRTVHGLHG